MVGRSVDVDVDGAARIAAVAARVRELGTDRVVVNNLAREIRSVGKPAKAAVKARALATLPARGGLNAWVARAAVRVAVRRGTRTAGVSLVAGRNSQRRRSDLKAIDAGRVRAPAWGRRTSWHVQAVTPGFFTEAVDASAVTEFRAGMVRAIERAEREVGL